MSSLGFDADKNYVLCRGTIIPRACDRFLRTNQDFERLRSDSLQGRLQPQTIVGFYPHTAAAFQKLIVPFLTCDIVAVVVDHEIQTICQSFPPQPIDAYMKQCIESPRIVHWFVENWRGPPHPNVTCRPIGLSWAWIRQPKLYAALLYEMDAAPPVEQKPLRVLANFHHHNHARPASGEMPNERKLIADKLRDHPLVVFDKWREQVDCWQIHREFAFEISPLGNGLDCHRTWEALLLNTIPIVRSCTLDVLHRDFPIVIVQGWDEVTEENLVKWRTSLAPQFTPTMKQKLNTKYWVDVIQDRATQSPENAK